MSIGSSLLGRLSEGQYRVAIIVVNAVLVVALVRMRFCYEPELPPLPPKPAAPSIAEAKATASRVDKNQAVYAEYLNRDAREYGIAPISPEKLAEAIPYRQSRMRQLLIPGGSKSSTEFAGLRLEVRTGQVEGSAREHLLFDIENTTDKHLAYRVTTRPSKGVQPCAKKKDLGHNAIALPPKGKITRSECIYQRTWGLEIERIEVMPISELSYYYVSSLPPQSLAIDTRASRGHLPAAGGRTCREVFSARVRRAIESGELDWRDLVDFYARHPCKVYDFPGDYRAWTEDAQAPLPAVPDP